MPHEGPHADDPVQRNEHLAVLALVPVSEATHTAVQSGLWSNPATWGGTSTSSVPTATSKVIIPADKTVTVDHGQADWIRVDGVMDFAVATESTLTVETIVVAPGGTLRNHSQATSRIVFADDGPIDTARDSFAFGRGLVSHGTTDIDGLDKSDWTTMEPTPAGPMQITVADPSGWRVGDRLVIGGSRAAFLAYQWQVLPEDDDVRIAAIAGNVVALDRPLAYAHAAVEGQNPVVINLTRNITFASANPAVDRRGHVMLMHSAAHSVKDAAFEDLGRTDKSKLVTDPDGKGKGLANPRGRYALHFHRTGVDDVASLATGVAIVGSPGWGLVNHDSHVIADSNVSYSVFGAHFVTELGNERGSFTNSVAVRTGGSGARVDFRRGNEDFGHTGEGFWLEGGLVEVASNVAIGAKNAGFTFFEAEAEPTQQVNFHENISYGSSTSLVLWNVGANGNNAPNWPQNRISSNLLVGGVAMGYASQIEFQNNTVVAFDSAWSPGFGHTGVNTHIRYIDNRVIGFDIGIQAPTEGDNLIQGGYYDNLKTNILIQNTQQNRYRTIDLVNPQFGEQAKWNIEMQASFFHYNLLAAYPELPFVYGGTFTNWRPLFETNWALGQDSHVTLDGVDLFFEEQGKDFEFGKRLTRLPDEIKLNPDGTLATGESLNARGLYVGGAPLPTGVQSHLAKIRGVLVGLA